jgi:hypothetical protein
MEGYPCLLSSGAPDSPVRHQTATVACLVRDLLPYRAYPTVAPRGWLAHRTLSSAPSRLLEQATCRALIAWTTVGAGAVGSPDSPVHHWTVR